MKHANVHRHTTYKTSKRPIKKGVVRMYKWRKRLYICLRNQLISAAVILTLALTECGYYLVVHLYGSDK